MDDMKDARIERAYHGNPGHDSVTTILWVHFDNGRTLLVPHAKLRGDGLRGFVDLKVPPTVKDNGRVLRFGPSIGWTVEALLAVGNLSLRARKPYQTPKLVPVDIHPGQIQVSFGETPIKGFDPSELAPDDVDKGEHWGKVREQVRETALDRAFERRREIVGGNWYSGNWYSAWLAPEEEKAAKEHPQDRAKFVTRVDANAATGEVLLWVADGRHLSTSLARMSALKVELPYLKAPGLASCGLVLVFGPMAVRASAVIATGLLCGRDSDVLHSEKGVVGTVPRVGRALTPCRSCMGSGQVAGAACVCCDGEGVQEVALAARPKLALFKEAMAAVWGIPRGFLFGTEIVAERIDVGAPGWYRKYLKEREIACPTCRRVFCKVLTTNAIIEVICEGCKAEGRADGG